MKKLLEGWKEFRRIMNTDTDVGRSKDNNITLIKRIVVILMCVSFALSVVNLFLKAYGMLIGTAIFTLCMGVCVFDCYRHKRVSVTVLLLVCTSTPLFTYFFICGGNDGFAALWILAIPMLFLFVCDLKVGFCSGLYFLVLVCGLCWVPVLRELVQYDYGKQFFIRFPFLYILMFTLSLRTGIQMKKHEIEQMHAMENLNKAVNDERNRNMKLFIQTIATINNAVEAKDEYTGEHSNRVALYSKMIAERLGWDEERQAMVFYAGLVHDIGKISIPDKIIQKPGRLDMVEYDRIKQHPASGRKILGEFDYMEGLSDGILYHHERYDGTGYPHRLAGEAIPEIARIIGVADAFDAMYSTRAYREKMPLGKVVEELKAGKGTQFDPYYVEVMIQLLEEGYIK